jgi:RNA polymerase sigma-70 factor, ECF subfamily
MSRRRAPERRGHAAGAMTVTSDEELLHEIANGRHDAVGELYARHAGAVFGMAARTFDPATAEEIVQDVFLAAWRGAASFDPSRGGAKPWLFAIARHRIANELRRRSRRPGDEAAAEAGDAEAVPDAAPDQAEVLWRQRRSEILRRALSRLPEGERAALGLAYFEDLPHGTVASLLGIPLGTAKSRIRSGVARLRLALGAAVAILVVAAAARLLQSRTALSRDERALEMLTSSEAVALRLTAAPGVPPDAHATYRFRPGSPIAVVTLSHFPGAAPGETDRAWARVAGRWIRLGEAVPDAAGHARRIAENPALGTPPERLLVTRETGPAGAEPGGRTMAAWEPDRK